MSAGDPYPLARIAPGVAALLLAALSCAPPHRARPYVATIPPLAYILREVVGDTAAVAVLLAPGASPHTYEPRPSDVADAQASRVLLHAAPTLDGWAARLPARRRIEAFALVPLDLRRALPLPSDVADARAHAAPAGARDPHFWTDPTVVLGMLPALVDTLCDIDAPRCTVYRANSARFADTLRSLDRELGAMLRPFRGRAVVLFHPSMQYMLARYGIVIAAVIEPSPGQEPTPRAVTALARTVARAGVTVLYTEPQLPRRPAEVVAELAHVRLDELDPLGGAPGRDSYAALLRHDARVLQRSLRQ